jgi:iron complex transport system ATP-binding protein
MKLEVHDLTCGYDARHPLQQYVNFAVDRGEICCILGPNGCGKSTLFKTILSLIPALGGCVTVDGSDISEWSPRHLSDIFAYVPQHDEQAFEYQVKDLVLMGRVSKAGRRTGPTVEDYQIAEDAMRQMGVYELRNKRYTHISGGELQLTLIAKALTQRPRILILDEPTSALDYGNVVAVIRKIKELAQQGYLILMTTHSPDHAFMCQSNVVLLRKDRPMKFGRSADVITEKNMRDAYGVDVKVVEFVNTKQEITRMCAPVF